MAGQHRGDRIDDQRIDDQTSPDPSAQVVPPVEAQRFRPASGRHQHCTFDQEDQAEQPGGGVDPDEEDEVIDEPRPEPHRRQTPARDPLESNVLAPEREKRRESEAISGELRGPEQRIIVGEDFEKRPLGERQTRPRHFATSPLTTNTEQGARRATREALAPSR